MEVLVIVLVLAGLVGLVIGVAFYVRLWSTLGMHRQAMHALHQHLSAQRVPRAPLGHVPPQEGRQ
jgi:hypothetical protein